MSEKLVLHFAPDNASLIVRIALEHLGVPYQTALVDRSVHAQRSPDYLKLNPLGLIPALETIDGVLFETGAILLWLGERYGGLLPSVGAPSRGAALKWLFFISNSLHAQLRQMFYTDALLSKSHSAELRTHLAQRIRADFDQIDQEIARRTSVGQPECLALDIYTAGLLRFAQLYPTDMPAGWVTAGRFPHILSLCARLESLPAVQAAQKAEGLGPTPFTAPRHARPPIGSAT